MMIYIAGNGAKNIYPSFFQNGTALPAGKH
jgi:hypothetical protein